MGVYHSKVIWKKPIVLLGFHLPEDITHDPLWWTDDVDGFRHYNFIQFGFVVAEFTISMCAYIGPVMLTMTWRK